MAYSVTSMKCLECIDWWVFTFRTYPTPKQFQQRRGGKRPKTPRSAFRQIGNAGDQVIKRMTNDGITLATGAGVVIAVQTLTSANVQSIPAAEFASFAARYQQYRVRAIRISGKAIQPIQTATVTHSVLFRGDFIGASGPATAAQVMSDENVKQCATTKDFVDIVTWKRNPNAKLWNPTSAVIPVPNQFAWACASSPAAPLLTGTTYYVFTTEWEVEFRGSQ